MELTTHMEKIAIVIGTRPDIIKMSPVIRACQQKNVNFFIINTGQHYSYDMEKVFLDELSLPVPEYNLKVGSDTPGKQTAKIICRIEEVFNQEKPDCVLVLGDTNTTLGSALAAAKLHIKIGHIEAGCRSYNQIMPEEINRIVTDHISDYLYVQSEIAKDILINEGIPDEKIVISGNTIVDAIIQNKKSALTKSDILTKLSIESSNYFLMTLHRQENVDIQDRFELILQGIDQLSKKYNVPVIFPVHPRTEKMIHTYDIRIPDNVVCIKPLDYLDFIALESNAKLILTDSGGVQFEACILKVPCLTLRDETEIPESVKCGANIVTGVDTQNIINSANQILSRDNTWINPFGDGHSGEQIIDDIIKRLS